MQVYVVCAEHYSVPGVVLKIFDCEAKARAECVELVNIMLDDSKLPRADLANWEGCLAVLQDIHGSANCYVEYQKMPVG